MLKYRFMCKFLLILLFLGGIFLEVFAQSGVTSKTEAVKFEQDKDTVWIINDKYSLYRKGFALTLDIEETDPGVVTVNWGENGGNESVSDTKPYHQYKERGLYDLQLTDTEGKIHHYMVFNKPLTIDFEIKPSPFKRCIEIDGDSLLIVKKGSDQNMPGTKYNVMLELPNALYEDRPFVDKLGEELEWQNDSAWVVFLQGTGVKTCRVYIEMTYEDEEKKIKLKDKSDVEREISVYQAPDVKKIFNFEYPSQEEIDTLKSISFMEACASNGQNYLRFDEDKLSYFQCKEGSSSPQPYYSSFDDHTDKFEIRYYYSDTIYEGMPESVWREVTGKADTVSETSEIDFRIPGYYKMMITAQNECNEFNDTLKVDTLFTELLPDSDKKRYFQIYSFDTTKIVCYADTLCWNRAEPIKIVDYNARRGFEAPPDYTYYAPELTLNNEDVATIREIIYKGNRHFETKPGEKKPDEVMTLGCDSTVIYIELKAKSYTGPLTLTMTRTTQCGETSCNFLIDIGNVPSINSKLFYDDLKDRYDVLEFSHLRCDTFRYSVPFVLLYDPDMARGFNLDSVYFYFKQGQGPEDSLVYRWSPELSPLTYLFDSTDVASNMRIRAYNACGASEDTLQIQVHSKPRLTLLRDSVPENDSLCVGMDYPYYWGWKNGQGNPGDIFDYYITSTGEVYLDKTTYGPEKSQLHIQYGTEVRYTAVGNYEEKFLIKHKAMPSCSLDTTLSVVILPQPDTLLYPDSISYCMGSPELNLKKLFGKEEPVFKWGEWKLNAGEMKRERFPEYTLTGQTDTLRYKLSQSTGCYLKGELLLRPREVPVLKLKETAQYCLPDTIPNFWTETNIVEDISWGGDYKLTVYQDEVSDINKRKNTKYVLNKDVKMLIYEMENTRVDTAFMGKCRLRDTVKLDLSVPVLELSKTVDSLTYPWQTYEFSHLEGEKFVKLEQINSSTVKWSTEGWEVAGNLYGGKYDLSDTDRQKDTLAFELSAQDLCGDELKDTLYVELYKLHVTGYKDTICRDRKNYPLWKKIKALHADLASVEWKIAEEYGGDLSKEKGWDATFTPKEVRTVHIGVKVFLEGAEDVSVETEIELTINEKPELKFNVDTLWVCDDKVELSKIHPDHIYTKNINGKVKRGDYVTEPGQTRYGSWSDDDYFFPINAADFTENVSQRVSYKAQGLPGCGEVRDTVVLVHPVPAKVVFKRAGEEMCAGERIKLDTLYTMEGSDRNTKLEWSLTSIASGRYEDNNTYYHASFPEDKTQELIVETRKEYTCYTGQPSTELFKSKTQLSLTVHREPEFKAVQKYDTLCRDGSEIRIKRDWVYVNTGIYPDYTDSLRLNGVPFGNDGLTYTIGNKGDLAKLVVTVAQGRCSNWKTKSDTIYVYRLPDMITGSFSVPSLCEGSASSIDRSRLVLHSLAANPSWSATGGSIMEEGDELRFSAASDVMDASVVLSVTPPKGCPPESMKVHVVIGRKPQLQSKEYRVCRLKGHEQLISAAMKDPTVKVQKIMWYRCGTPDEYIGTTGETETEWELHLTDADVQQPDGLCLEARITSVGACVGEFKDTVRIIWQEQPDMAMNPITICQADPDGVNLRAEVEIKYAGEESWTLQTVAAGSMSGSRFYPGEYSGTANVQVTALGLFGCPDGNWTVPVTVETAPESGIATEGENCTRRQVEMRPVSSRTQSYDWDFGDGTPQLNGGTDPVSHLYDVAGTYQVVMTANFANGCKRKEYREWTVHPTPQAAFNLPEYVPVAPTGVELLSTSSPETVACQWTVDNGESYDGSSVPYYFTAAGDHSVRLVVTAPEGCTDTVQWQGKALEKPKAEFAVEVDSCGGKVKITNLSVVEQPDAREWDFGNGQTSTAEHPADLYYPLPWNDTTYAIRLKLTNISGSDEHVEYVKIISQLKAGFEEWKTVCDKSEKQIRILTRGNADTTGIDWGDGTPAEVWSGNGVNILPHNYPENETSASHSYTIRLRVKNACWADTAKSVVTVIPQQRLAKVTEADSMPGYTNKCFGYDRMFKNKSFGFLPQGYFCEWNFGDGTPWEAGADSLKKHAFDVPGIYTVRLRVKDECEERMDSLRVKVYGNDRLDFAFGKDENRLCVGDSIPVWFVQRGEAPFSSLKWTMPDGRTRSNIDTVYYKFSRSGNFSVMLEAKSEGCADSEQKSGNVHRTPDPSISFSVSSGDVKVEDCVTSLELPFRAVNHEKGMEGVSIFWDFGDASSSIEETPPVKRFEKAGGYTVRLKMTSAEGCVACDSLSVVAKETPEAKLELSRRLICSDAGDFGLTVYNRTEEADSCSFVWYRGGEIISMVPDSVSMSFAGRLGKERISIRADHRRTGCSSWAFDTVVVSPEVKAALRMIPDTVCAGTEVLFEDISVAEGGTRTLLFDDGSAGQGAEITKYFGQPGKYGYRFLVTNADGCGAEIEDMFQVHSLPAAEFEWLKDNSLLQIEGVRDDIVLPPDKDNGGIRFTNASQAPFLDWENRELYYRWDFGDGEVSYEKDPVHLFDNNGFYNVWLHAFSRMGCRDSVSHTVAIEAVKGLYFPNAMIPADPDPGKNRFQPKGIGLYSFTLKIYARTGDCIWQTDKLENGCPAEYWDGTWNGEVVPAGVYTWQASAVFIDGSVRNWMNGSLVVIR